MYSVKSEAIELKCLNAPTDGQLILVPSSDFLLESHCIVDLNEHYMHKKSTMWRSIDFPVLLVLVLLNISLAGTVAISNVTTTKNTRALQNSTVEDQVCEGFRKLFYTTDYERQSNPCADGCTFNSATNELTVECRYDYCPECSEKAEVCAVRLVQYSRTLAGDQEMTALINGDNSFVMDAMDYCLDYVQGRSGDPVCTTVGRFTSVNCKNIDNIKGGPPLLFCDEQQCLCLEERDKIDYDSPFVGFATLPFQSCYDASVKAITTLDDSAGSIFPTNLFMSVISFIATFFAVRVITI